VVGILGHRSLGASSASARLIYESNVARIKAVGQLKWAVAQARVDAANRAFSPDEASTTRFTQAFTTDQQDFDAAMTAYRRSMPAGNPATIEDLQQQWDGYTELANDKPAADRRADVHRPELEPAYVRWHPRIMSARCRRNGWDGTLTCEVTIEKTAQRAVAVIARELNDLLGPMLTHLDKG